MNEAKYHDPAIKVFNKIIGIDSLNADAYNYLSIIYDTQRKDQLATYYFEKARKINPNLGKRR